MNKKVFTLLFISLIYCISFAQNVGIGVSNPAFRLDVADRMRIRSGGSNFSSPGIWLNNINNSGQVGFIGVYDDTYMGWFGNSGAAWNLLMNVNNGNIGIGNQNPSFKLDISGRMRLRSGGGVNTAGLYLNKEDNSSVQAFVGMKDDNYVGFFGVPQNNWGLLMNTANGNVGINTSTPQALLHIVRGAKTNGPVLPTSSAVIDGNQGGWLQFSNNNNIESGILSGNQQTSIRSGIVFGADSSIQLRSGGNVTNLSIDKSGNVAIDNNISAGGNATITGNVIVTGEVRRSSTGSANMVPIAYGSVSLIGVINSGTGNFTITWMGNGRYRLNITGQTLNTTSFIFQITQASSGFASVGILTGELTIFTHDSSGLYADSPFHFVVYKP